MASASLQGLHEESICSICLEYLKDPVITECGHNFCQACLAKCWEGLGDKVISCPQCREKVRRKLIPNRQLANFVELTRKLHFQEEKSPKRKGGICGRHHGEPLKLFCMDDEALICVVCNRSKEHKDHWVVPLEEAAQELQHLICSHLELLEEERAKILACKTETEGKSHELLKQTKAELEKTKEQFREIYSFLNNQEKLLLAQLVEVEKEIAKKRDDHLARLSGELSSLGGLIQEMNRTCQQPPGELLQGFRSILQSCKKKEPFQTLLPFPSELNAKISEVCDRNNFLAGLMKQLNGSLLTRPLQQKANVTLDPDTAHPRLVLSGDCKSVRYGDRYQLLHNNPERFDKNAFVLGCEGFTRGRHSWKVTIGKEGFWAVGMARKSVRRKGIVGLKSKEGIWAIVKWVVWGQRSEYWATNDPDQSVLSPSENLRKIRVSLNCEEGQVAFHDGDTGSHLYTFSGASFSEEILLPFFSVDGRASLTISP